MRAISGEKQYRNCKRRIPQFLQISCTAFSQARRGFPCWHFLVNLRPGQRCGVGLEDGRNLQHQVVAVALSDDLDRTWRKPLVCCELARAA